VNESRQKIMLTNYSVGNYKLFLKKMIEFSLQVEPRIISSILPELEKIFAKSHEIEDFSNTVLNFDDSELEESWIDGLKEDVKSDRVALAKLLKSPKLPYGRVEVEDSDVDDLLRGLTEIRFTIRKTSLEMITDEELENGLPKLKSANSRVKIGYFGYLLVAEIQERLIHEIS
jgi:glutaredoxin 2